MVDALVSDYIQMLHNISLVISDGKNLLVFITSLNTLFI